MSSSKTGHLGKAGHHAVMAELLLRGWNVAIPEVDVGDDVFVVDDNADAVLRVQVKTTATKGPLDGNRPFKAQYGGLSRRDLDVSTLPFFYVFVLRVDHFWEFVVIDRAELKRRRDVGEQLGRLKSQPGVALTLALMFTAQDVTLWGDSIQAHRNDWGPFRPVTTGRGASAR